MQKITFKKYLIAEKAKLDNVPDTDDGSVVADSFSSVALEKAAKFLKTTVNYLKQVSDKSIENKILDAGREITKDFIRMASGTTVVRLFSLLGKNYARIESPNGQLVFYTV